MVGESDFLIPIKAVQAKLNELNEKDGSECLAKRPKRKECQWGTPLPPIK